VEALLAAVGALETLGDAGALARLLSAPSR
jgi:hypothetical protein